MGDLLATWALRLMISIAFVAAIDWATGLTVWDLKFWCLVVSSGAFWCAMEAL